MNIAVFVSGNGTNLQAIIDAVLGGKIKAKIRLVVSDNEDAYALTRARDANIETFVLSPKGFSSREDYDKEIIKELEKKDIGLIVLAGFMRLVSDLFIKKYKNKILNVHPALLPSFKGMHGIKDAFLYGVKKTGVTVHFVDEKLDHGPIILQEAVEVEENETLETLEAKIHKIEHRLYPEAIRLFTEGKLKIENRKVKIKEA
ncbi:MAG: phosphoribosylglycinamide formyltransferase [Candidatus Omnitrophica bacterium]|nr:phosphoribosylglycinamide formyltransferase [Candidatus Omnitrophota bacterium]